MMWPFYGVHMHCVHGTSCLCTLSASAAFMHWTIPTWARFLFRNFFMETCTNRLNSSSTLVFLYYIFLLWSRNEVYRNEQYYNVNGFFTQLPTISCYLYVGMVVWNVAIYVVVLVLFTLAASNVIPCLWPLLASSYIQLFLYISLISGKNCIQIRVVRHYHQDTDNMIFDWWCDLFVLYIMFFFLQLSNFVISKII